MTRSLVLAGLLLTAAAPLAAQDSSAVQPAAVLQPDANGVYPWRTSWFPALQGSVNDGPMLALRLRSFQMAQFEDQVANRQSFDAVAGATIRGSFLGLLRYQGPRIADGWRLWAQAQASGEARFGYFGLGNSTVSSTEATDTDPLPYRARRNRFELRSDVTRRISGPLRVALGVHVEHARFSALEGNSTFRTQFGGATLAQTDVGTRLALVTDTRDTEFDPTRGVLLEAGAEVGAGAGGGGYSRLYSVLRGYASLDDNTVVAARLLGSDLRGAFTLNSRYVIPTWEQPTNVLGGQFSQRGLEFGRFAGSGVLVGNLEVRRVVGTYRGAVDFVVVGFADAGRVFEGERFRLTTQDLKVAGGLGFGVKLLRSTVFVMNVARGPEGWRVSANNGWMF